LADHSVHNIIQQYIWLQIISRPFDGGGDNNIIYKTTYYNNILYCDYDNAPAVPQVVVARSCHGSTSPIFLYIVVQHAATT